MELQGLAARSIEAQPALSGDDCAITLERQ